MPSTVGNGSANVSSPTLTINACVIASVYGRRIRNRVPCARLRLDAHRAAELLDLVVDDVHADAAAGSLSQLAGRAEPRLQDQLDGLLVGDLLILREQALSRTPCGGSRRGRDRRRRRRPRR